MLKINDIVFDGSAQDLRDRINAFKEALEDHKHTEGVPAPMEHPLVERAAKSEEIFSQVEAAVEAELMPTPDPTPVEVIRSLESAVPITQRHLREMTLLMASQAGQVTQTMLNPLLPLDEESPAWKAISVGVQRCVLQERAIRVERAKL